jgi:hypothetical protein
MTDDRCVGQLLATRKERGQTDDVTVPLQDALRELANADAGTPRAGAQHGAEGKVDVPPVTAERQVRRRGVRDGPWRGRGRGGRAGRGAGAGAGVDAVGGREERGEAEGPALAHERLEH